MQSASDNSIGLIGLGVMGRNLALNFSDHGVSVTAWDPWPEARDWQAEGVTVATDLAAFIAALPQPRNILLMIKAGPPVDDMIKQLKPHLSPGDCIIDGGNAHFSDTDRRGAALQEDGLLFAGVGVSGGAEGARHGPAMMAGGSDEFRTRIAPLLQRIVARVDDQPCFGWFGPGGAGHYVKMVHNGIEYAVMQAIAEVCHALHHAGGLAWPEVADILAGAEQGYLVEITAEILRTPDDLSDGMLIDRIDDSAGQKGTGGWCVADALELGVAVPAMAEAVAARQISSGPRQRRRKPARAHPLPALAAQAAAAIDTATVVALAQGFALAERASSERGWAITVPAMAASWRAGSILRMPLLAELQTDETPDGLPLPLARRLASGTAGLRAFAVAALAVEQPVPVLTACLGWIDSIDLQTLPTAIVQAQRDRFGDHGFRRTDRPGTFHGPWNRTGA